MIQIKNFKLKIRIHTLEFIEFKHKIVFFLKLKKIPDQKKNS